MFLPWQSERLCGLHQAHPREAAALPWGLCCYILSYCRTVLLLLLGSVPGPTMPLQAPHSPHQMHCSEIPRGLRVQPNATSLMKPS